jgi:glycosyltransferase involved in cell wall biosynthesis
MHKNLLMVTGIGSAENLASDKRGAFYYTLEEFHKYWDRIDIVVPRVKNPVKNIFGNVFIHSSPLPLFFHPLFFIYKVLKLNREIKFNLMTVQEFPPFYNGIGAWIISVFAKIPYVLEIHHIPGYPKAGNTKEKIYKQLMGFFIRFDAGRAKAVRVVNQKETPDFLVKVGVPKEKIIYIPSAYVDLSVFRPTNLLKEYDVIFIGRLADNKGVNLFVEAIKKMRARAIIVGDGPLAENLRCKIKNKNLEKQIIFNGWAKDQKEIAELLNKSKILIMPSYNEGGPRVVVEALACGVPVLATPVGIVLDLLKNGLGGEIIDWRSDDIAQKALGLLNDQGKYQRYSQSGPEIIKQFEKKEAIKNYAEKLQNLIS